jgi:hypothetical protein
VAGGWNVGTSIETGVVNAGNATSRSNSCYVVDSPQQLRNCDVQNPYQHRIKLSGSYPLPYNFQFSAVFQNLPGVNYGALYAATTAQILPSLGRNLAGGVKSVTIDLLPTFSEFGDRMTQVDVRGSKKFKVGRTSIQANVDVYNLLNSSTTVGFNSTFTNQAKWLQPTQIVDARLAKFSVQFDF